MNAVGNPKRILYSTGGDHQPRYSPDGHRIAFISERSGGQQVWVADADEGNLRQLTNLQAHVVAFPRWSPDGKFLAFGARVPDVAQSYVVRVEDGAIRRVTDNKGGGDAPSWSMDGNTLYVNEEIGAVSYVSRVPSAGGTPEPLWPGWFPVEAPGRKLLLYGKKEQFGLFARSLVGDPKKNPELRLADDFWGPFGAIYPVDDGVYYPGYSSNERPRAFRFYSFKKGKSVDIAPAPEYLFLGLSVSPDRTHLAYAAGGGPVNTDLVEIKLK
jgi:dipeptidyl aminopeptidase/acylaminoacyl peptidase